MISHLNCSSANELYADHGNTSLDPYSTHCAAEKAFNQKDILFCPSRLKLLI